MPQAWRTGRSRNGGGPHTWRIKRARRSVRLPALRDTLRWQRRSVHGGILAWATSFLTASNSSRSPLLRKAERLLGG